MCLFEAFPTGNVDASKFLETNKKIYKKNPKYIRINLKFNKKTC